MSFDALALLMLMLGWAKSSCTVSHEPIWDAAYNGVNALRTLYSPPPELYMIEERENVEPMLASWLT